jgi:hypothetical protein
VSLAALVGVGLMLYDTGSTPSSSDLLAGAPCAYMASWSTMAAGRAAPLPRPLSYSPPSTALCCRSWLVSERTGSRISVQQEEARFAGMGVSIQSQTRWSSIGSLPDLYLGVSGGCM